MPREHDHEWPHGQNVRRELPKTPKDPPDLVYFNRVVKGPR